MNKELLRLIKKHTEMIIEQLKTKPKKTTEFTLNKGLNTFSFSHPINVYEEGKWLLAVTFLETTNSGLV